VDTGLDALSSRELHDLAINRALPEMPRGTEPPWEELNPEKN
jgi:hypothetical protein